MYYKKYTYARIMKLIWYRNGQLENFFNLKQRHVELAWKEFLERTCLQIKTKALYILERVE